MNAAMNTETELRVAAWPGLTPRLLRTEAGIEDLAAYRSAERLPAPRRCRRAPRPRSNRPVWSGAAVRRSPWRSSCARCASSGTCDGTRSSSPTVKRANRLRSRTGGCCATARTWSSTACGWPPASSAPRTRTSTSRTLASARAVETALADAGTEALDGLTVSVRTVEPGYVAGEETAAVRAINGGPAKPTDKPPRPFEQGVGGLPTLVSNVETLANLPYIHRHGAQTYRAAGTAASPGTFLATITGGGGTAGPLRGSFGVSFTELLTLHGLPPEKVRGVLMGGYFAGVLNREVLDTTLDHETMRGIGSGLGCGAVSVITDECPVAVAASVLDYFDRENAGQCGSCFNGTAAMAAAAGALRDGTATTDDVARLRRWSVVLRGRGACATLDAATNIAASLLDKFPGEVAGHLDAGLGLSDCAAGMFSAERPYEVEAPA